MLEPVRVMVVQRAIQNQGPKSDPPTEALVTGASNITQVRADILLNPEYVIYHWGG